MGRSILIYLGLAIVGIILLVVFIRTVIIPFFKFLFCFLKWIFKTLPILILIAIFIPGFIDEGAYFIVILILAIADSIKLRGSDYTGEHFILNKKSKIAHRASDPSADTIGYNHREDVYATESELESRGFRIKKDN